MILLYVFTTFGHIYSIVFEVMYVFPRSNPLSPYVDICTNMHAKSNMQLRSTVQEYFYEQQYLYCTNMHAKLIQKFMLCCLH